MTVAASGLAAHAGVAAISDNIPTSDSFMRTLLLVFPHTIPTVLRRQRGCSVNLTEIKNT
jgi:hypothetical protein